MTIIASPVVRLAAAALCLAAARPARALDKQDISLSGAGWIQFGIVGHSSDTMGRQDFNGHSLYSSGAQLSLQTRLNDDIDARAGLGVVASHPLIGSATSNGGYAPMSVSPYVSEANFTWKIFDHGASMLSLRTGLFPYDYNPDVQNLGLYLLRGPVYPGLLISGFETKYVLPVADMLGLQLHHESGAFQQDLLLSSETEFYPYFDLSPAYVAGYRFGKLLRVGAGVNFYHWIPIEDSLTSDRKWFYVQGPDTTYLSFKGVKVMADAALDPKAWFSGAGSLGAEDLKVYGEVALIGIKNNAAYKAVYGDALHRMPMMAGFNLPMFGLLDRLSLEVEWYGARFLDDMRGFNHTAGNHQPPVPPDPQYPNDLPPPNQPVNLASPTVFRRDDWKWSLYGSRVIQGHLKISFQIADDHFRPGVYAGDGDNAPVGSESLMLSPKDWYWMSKLAYFF